MRVRFAPSPTGLLHIGGLRTALYNFLLAKKEGGAFILRIEDTDRTRFVPEAEEDILSSLKWAGLSFDEGPGIEGAHSPYYQSERSALYSAAAATLIESGKAYIAFDTPPEIEELKQRYRTKENPNPRYDHVTRGEMTNSLSLTDEEVQERLSRGDAHVIRMKIDPGHWIEFKDEIRGEVRFESGSIDDQVLVKSDGLPTYHLANIVDDHAMEITHVIRGEEWLPSTPKHIFLYEALGWQAPSMAHLPLILSPTGGKLSKRNAEKQGIPVSVAQYREAGYEPEALINFLALLGWNPGDEREIFQLEELSRAFSLERVGQSGVQFDLQKLEWFNQHYLRLRSDGSIAAEMAGAVEERYPDYEIDKLDKAVGMMKERMSFAKDILETSFLFERPAEYDEKSVRKRWNSESPEVLGRFAKRLEQAEEWSHDSLEAELKDMVEQEEIGMGKLMFPLRLGLSGTPSGPGLYEMMVYFGKEETINRLRTVIDRLN